jgi:Acyl-CoA synthetase (NDP forming)
MVKFSKNFFQDKEVLFVGYSSRNKAYSNGILQGFTDNNIKVYPFNTKENASFDTKVYKSFEELPVMPKSAFVLLNKANSEKVVRQLIEKGVKKILFYSKIEPQLQAECDKAGVEIAFGCPLMAYGKGMHKIHAFFAGVK